MKYEHGRAICLPECISPLAIERVRPVSRRINYTLFCVNAMAICNAMHLADGARARASRLASVESCNERTNETHHTRHTHTRTQKTLLTLQTAPPAALCDHIQCINCKPAREVVFVAFFSRARAQNGGTRLHDLQVLQHVVETQHKLRVRSTREHKHTRRPRNNSKTALSEAPLMNRITNAPRADCDDCKLCVAVVVGSGVCANNGNSRTPTQTPSYTYTQIRTPHTLARILRAATTPRFHDR